MPTLIKNGEEFTEIDALELFPPDEGSINQWYGHIGSGKTYGATCEILEKLKQGKVIYATWKIKWEGYDERKEFFPLILGILGLKKFFAVYPKENLRFFEINEEFYKIMGRLTSCEVYLDEGHIAFDSYQLAKMSMEKRLAVLDTRHYDRTINIISQRPSAVHATIRGNVNRFYKMEEKTFFKWKIFTRKEYQDVDANEKPDENKDAITEKTFWGRKKIYQLYDSKYRRQGIPESQKNLSQLYKLSWKESMKNLIGKNKLDKKN